MPLTTVPEWSTYPRICAIRFFGYFFYSLVRRHKHPSMTPDRINWLLVAAAALAFVVGLVHSLLGERLIFRRMRVGGVIPTNGGTVLREAHVRILWASWHVLTVFGWCIAALLLWLSQAPPQQPSTAHVANLLIVTMLASSGIVLIGTKGKHSGWVGLLGVALLILLARW